MKYGFLPIVLVILCLAVLPLAAFAAGEMPAVTDIVEAESEKTVVLEAADSRGVVSGTTGVVTILRRAFPDPVFQAYVQENFDSDDNWLLTDEEAAAATAIDVSGLGVKSLEGIKYLPALEMLNCGDNALETLDLSGNTALAFLWCGGCGLGSLDVSMLTELVILDCQENNLTSLDVSRNPNLETLYTNGNDLAELDVRNNQGLLEYVKNGVFHRGEYNAYGYGGEGEFYAVLAWDKTTALITGISKGLSISEENFPDPVFRSFVKENYDLNGDGGLSETEIEDVTNMDCAGRGIQDLGGIEYFTKLTSLTCEDNPLKELDLSQNTALAFLWCGGCGLGSLDVSMLTELVILDCQENDLALLNVSGNPNLETLYTNGNDLALLDVRNNPGLLEGVENGQYHSGEYHAYGFGTGGEFHAILTWDKDTQLVFEDAAGDLNGDGRVDPLDMVCLMKNLIGAETTITSAEGDLNKNGEMDLQDLIWLAYKLAE